MTTLGPCVYCGAMLESTIAHVCPSHPGGHPPKTFWTLREAEPAPTPHEDSIGAPSHYTWHPSGIQPKDFVGEFTYNVGTAMVYEWRAGRKEGVDVIDDLRKAITHLRFEIERIEKSRA